MGSTKRKYQHTKVLTSAHVLSADAASSRSWWSELKLLFKFRLSVMVVFSSAMGYLILVGNQVNLYTLIALCIGGFLITGAANALNQVLEKDFDKLMQRTMNRPIAAGRMKVSEAVLIAGISTLIGVGIISVINPLAGFIAMLSLVLYAFVYTPLKRVTPLAVLVGSIPGALPVLVGGVLAEGNIGTITCSIFLIQVVWQLPHFWAVAWLAHEDYTKAGYYLLPSGNKEKDENVGWACFKYALLLIPLSIIPFYLGAISIVAMLLMLIFAGIYSWFGWNLYKKCDRKSALNLMFSSFFYLPLTLIIMWLDILIF